MKIHAPIYRRVSRLAALVVAWVLVAGASAQVRDGVPGPALIEKDGAAERPALKEVPFLGVSTHRADTEVAAKGKSARGTGLVVERVMVGSPAEGILKPQDLLTRLDGEELVDPRQLGVLIRSRAEGVEVALTVVRAGKEQVVRVKLGRRAMPPLPERARPALP
ncbi:PDZ domain-containing protein [Nibricoccus aquaticus]|nr:PDZ domain-containing protein [Nibricoccus aquaticus]